MRGDLSHMEPYRLAGEPGGEGAFHHGPLRFIASWSGGWDHVSVSRRDRCPTWDEMHAVKRLFFDDDEAVMQLHPPAATWRNAHPYCLHLWRPQDSEIPLPPPLMVAPAGVAVEP